MMFQLSPEKLMFRVHSRMRHCATGTHFSQMAPKNYVLVANGFLNLDKERHFHASWPLLKSPWPHIFASDVPFGPTIFDPRMNPADQGWGSGERGGGKEIQTDRQTDRQRIFATLRRASLVS